jgi:hypothetical protein
MNYTRLTLVIFIIAVFTTSLFAQQRVFTQQQIAGILFIGPGFSKCMAMNNQRVYGTRPGKNLLNKVK